MRPRWLSGFRDFGHRYIMEMRTSDGVVYALKDEFVRRSTLLTNLMADAQPSMFDIPFGSKSVWYLERREYPEDGSELLEVAKAADYLCMDEDLDEACRRVAEKLKGKTASEIKKFLGIS